MNSNSNSASGNFPSPLYLKQLEVGPMENFIYLIGDRNTKECVMVDPAWDVQSVLDAAAEDGMKVTGGIVTHTHYDHVNGAGDLLNRIDGKLYVHKNEAGQLKDLKGELVPTEGGTKLEIGEISITFIHTPGHTPGSQCFLIRLRGQAEDEGSLVSGDTLFINACGRCDLPGGNAEQMYYSLQELAKLRDSIILLPGHHYAEQPTSTIGREKAYNPYYQAASLHEFLTERMS